MSETKAKDKWSRSGYDRLYKFESVADFPDLLLLTVISEVEVKNITEETQAYYAKTEFEPKDSVKSVYYRITLGDKVLCDAAKPLVASDTRRDILEARTADVKVPAGETVTVTAKWVSLVDRKSGDGISFGKPIEGLTVRVKGPDGVDFLAEFATEPDAEGTDRQGAPLERFWTWHRTFVEWQHVNVRWWSR